MDPNLPEPPESSSSPDSSDLPTPPSVPVPPAQPTWPGLEGGRPPSGGPPWHVIGIIGAALVIVAVVAGVLIATQGGTTIVVVVPSAAETATAASAHATASAGARGTPTAIPTATATAAPTATATATPTPTPAGPPATHFVLVQATISTGTPVVATCPAGELALSGGWASSAAAPIYNSSRSGNGWQVFANGSGALVNSYVTCLQHDPGTSVTERQATVNVGAGTHDNTYALCETGEWVVGGGYNMPPSGVEIYSLGANGNAWGGYARNTTGSSQAVTFYAECLHAPGGQTFATSPATTTMAPGASGGTQVGCSSGEMLTGGGYADDENAVVYSSSPNSNTTWGVYLQNNGGSPNGLGVYAMCLAYT